jgi:hypothetical protein
MMDKLKALFFNNIGGIKFQHKISVMPLRRQDWLIPFSRAHHRMLIVAQVLKSDVPAYAGMPATPEGQREYALHQLTELIQPEFEQVARQLIALTQQSGGQVYRLGQAVLKEQQELLADFAALDKAAKETLPALLDDLGHRLSAHVRFKERICFTALQEDEEVQQQLEAQRRPTASSSEVNYQEMP